MFRTAVEERAAADTRRFARARGPHLLDIVNREGSNTGGSGSGGGSGAARLSTYACARASSVKSVLNWANVSTRTLLEVFGEASWFLTGRTFLREPSWKYSSKGSKNLRSTCSGNIRPIVRSLPLIG